MTLKPAGRGGGGRPVADQSSHLAQARPLVRSLPISKVREIANAGFGQSDIARFWFGESDQPTPDYIKQAAIDAISGDQTFYVHNNGRSDLRGALACYIDRLHNQAIEPSRVSITSSGVSALQIAMQAVLDPGDQVVIVTPIWPNVAEIPRILGAEVVRVGLEAHAGQWRLDVDRLLRVVTARTRLLIINSPNNPTGWTLPAADRQPILEHCRRLGVWLLVDDVYERLVFDGTTGVAPSFLSIADPEDRLIGANSFSKAWLMTGWRLGWLVTPATLETDIGKLIEFNTSCAPDFVQAAGLAAIEQGEQHVARLRDDLRASRDRLVGQLVRLPGIEASPPAGGMYVFLRIAGEPDSVALAKQLIQHVGLGLAPGVAFGPEGEGWLRWCFAARPEALDLGLDRLEGWLGSQSQVRPGRR